MQLDLETFLSKTSPDGSTRQTTPSAVSWEQFSDMMMPCIRQQTENGPVAVWLPGLSEGSVGRPLTRNSLEWRSDAAVCSLSSILETGPIPPRFFLSRKACLGILRRAEKRGKELPEQLRAALSAVAQGESQTAMGPLLSGSRTGGGRPLPAVAFEEPTVIMERGRQGGSNLEYRQDGTANAILTPNGGRGGIGVGAIQHQWQVRRLTPVECERLQGFPDDFTNIEYRGKPAADGPRYKALGNSWAVPVGRWILERIERFMPDRERLAA